MTGVVERGCVESDEISRSNTTEFRVCGHPGMGWTRTEGTYAIVPTGLKPLCSPTCVPSARPNYVGIGTWG